MLHYCNRHIHVSAQLDAKQIIKTLKAILLGQLENDLTLQHFYQDVPVAKKAAINTVRGEEVEITAHKLQALIMVKEQDALIRTAHLPHPVLARVRKVDKTNRAKLVDFCFVKVPANSRRHIWVRLRNSPTARFRNSRYVLEGTIRNISLGGVAVFNSTYLDIPVGSVGALTLELDGSSLMIPATLLRATVSDQYIKYIFKLDQGSRAEPELARIIARRQSEIIRNLMSEG